MLKTHMNREFNVYAHLLTAPLAAAQRPHLGHRYDSIICLSIKFVTMMAYVATHSYH